MHGQLSVSVWDMEDPFSIPNSRKLEVPEMVQTCKDAVINDQVQGPPKGEQKMLQLKLLLRMLPMKLLKKMVLTTELKKSKSLLKMQKYLLL